MSLSIFHSAYATVSQQSLNIATRSTTISLQLKKLTQLMQPTQLAQQTNAIVTIWQKKPTSPDVLDFFEWPSFPIQNPYCADYMGKFMRNNKHFYLLLHSAISISEQSKNNRLKCKIIVRLRYWLQIFRYWYFADDDIFQVAYVARLWLSLS